MSGNPLNQVLSPNQVPSPNQVLTHAARAAAKQLNFQPPLVAARGAREGLWLEQQVPMYARVPEYALMHFQAKNSKENRDTRGVSCQALQSN